MLKSHPPGSLDVWTPEGLSFCLLMFAYSDWKVICSLKRHNASFHGFLNVCHVYQCHVIFPKDFQNKYNLRSLVLSHKPLHFLRWKQLFKNQLEEKEISNTYFKEIDLKKSWQQIPLPCLFIQVKSKNTHKTRQFKNTTYPQITIPFK